jgi:hypothetical protein
MTYNETYETGDLAPITGDVLGGIGAGIAPLAPIVGIFLALGVIVGLIGYIIFRKK